jgi:hypothetical protein
MIPRTSSQLVPSTLEPGTVSVSVVGGVVEGVGVGDRCARTVALSWLECVPAADDAVATFVTLPAVTSAGVIVYDALQVIEAPTARLAVTGQFTLALSSATVNGPPSASFPLLVSR